MSSFAVYIASIKWGHRKTIADIAKRKCRADRRAFIAAVRKNQPGLFTLVGRHLLRKKAA